MKLKQSLLYMIINNALITKRYSQAYHNIRMVVELEEKEDKRLIEMFKKELTELDKLYKDFKNGIPLEVIEAYYITHSANLNEFLYIEFQDKELYDIKVIDLYMDLENFYNKCYVIAVRIANYYNLEIKVNRKETENYGDMI